MSHKESKNCRSMKKVKKTYLKTRRLILGNGRTQKGGLFAIAAAFALLTADLIGKMIGRGKKKSKAKTKEIETCRR